MIVPDGLVPELSSRAPGVVVCVHCRTVVQLHHPLPKAGWQVVHACGEHVLEVQALAAGQRPWDWRQRDVERSPRP